ncbi:MAG: alkaline phosphatase family protein [Pseudodesulfovibrio sp.]
MTKKCVLILLDGLGDRALPQLNHRTPLQAAMTPCLDQLAARGSTGLYHAGKIGCPLPSENAHFALFGCAPDEFPGRGALEALGAGVKLGEGDVALLAHFACVLATLNGTLILRYDRVCGTPEETDALFEAVGPFESEGVRIELTQTGGMFSVLTLHGDVSPFITDSNPMVDGRRIPAVRPLASHEDDPAAVRTARVLSTYLRRAFALLAKTEVNQIRAKQKLPPINGLITQRAGRLCPVTPLHVRYGMRCLSLASGVMYRGMAKFLGMDFMRMKDTRDPGNDLAERVELAVRALADYDFIHIHTKAPDHAAHTKSPRAKLNAIESLDRGLAASVKQLLRDDVILVVTADHSTPSMGALIHSGEPVPLLFVGEGVRRDAVDRYDEISVAGGCLGTMRGDELMHMVLNYTDRACLAGINDTPWGRQYWPGDYEAFSLHEPEER